MAGKGEQIVLDVAGREVVISNPSKIYFPQAGINKLDVVRYYLAVAEGALRGAGGRPNVLVRYANGIHGEFFYQKRAPEKRPEWIEVASIRFPSGRTADWPSREFLSSSPGHCGRSMPPRQGPLPCGTSISLNSR